MNRTLLIVMLVAASILCSPAFAQTKAATAPASGPTTAAAAVPAPTVPLPAGMTSLFDGKTLAGWVQAPGEAWTVRDGVIASLGAGRGVIYTVGVYDRYR